MSAEFELSRKTARGLLVAGLLATSAVTSSFFLPHANDVQAATATTIDPTRGFSELVDRVMPAVVSVEVKFSNATANTLGIEDIPPQFKEFFDRFPQLKRPDGEPRREGGGQGSGFVVSADGYVITNNHVVSDAKEVKLTFDNGEVYTAKVVGTDSKTDLALLKIDAKKTLPFVSLSDAPAKVGDWVMAVGNPFGLGGTVTTGIVSARGRNIGSGPYDDFLQIDASINSGNSGGPAFNLEGEVIGVNTAIFSPSGGSVGIGFAIPAAMVKDIVATLKESGSVTRGWLGVRMGQVSEDGNVKGALVAGLTEQSPAATAGIKSGDIILKFDGKEIVKPQDLSRAVAAVKPGATVPVDIIRSGKNETIQVKIGAMPEINELKG